MSAKIFKLSVSVFSDEDVLRLAQILQQVFENLPFNLRCIDWLSYNADKYIHLEKKRLLADKR